MSDAVVDSLGELERKVLVEVRRQGSANVAGICESLDRSYAYTTVMTTLDRLYKKGLLERTKAGRAFIYSARSSAEELDRALTADVMSTLLDTDPASVTPVLACIVDSVSGRDRLLLDELERLVREKRIELDKQDRT